MRSLMKTNYSEKTVYETDSKTGHVIEIKTITDTEYFSGSDSDLEELHSHVTIIRTDTFTNTESKNEIEIKTYLKTDIKNSFFPIVGFNDYICNGYGMIFKKSINEFISPELGKLTHSQTPSYVMTQGNKEYKMNPVEIYDRLGPATIDGKFISDRDRFNLIEILFEQRDGVFENIDIPIEIQAIERVLIKNELKNKEL